MNNNSKPKLRGQTLVEFALILPIFLFLAVVIFDFGRAVYYYSAIHNAAREGARYGIIYPKNTSGMQQAAINYAVGLDLKEPDVTAGWSEVGSIDNSKVYEVTVKINYCFVPVTPLVEKFIIKDCSCGCNNMLLTSEAVMRTEADPTK
jgi:Flp pilus assembly protein TadG